MKSVALVGYARLSFIPASNGKFACDRSGDLAGEVMCSRAVAGAGYAAEVMGSGAAAELKRITNTEVYAL